MEVWVLFLWMCLRDLMLSYRKYIKEEVHQHIAQENQGVVGKAH